MFFFLQVDDDDSTVGSNQCKTTNTKTNLSLLKNKRRKNRRKKREILKKKLLLGKSDTGNGEYNGKEVENTSPKRKINEKETGSVKKQKVDTQAINEDVTGNELQSPKTITSQSSAPLPDMSAWKHLFVPDCVLKALSELGFTKPMPIQEQVIFCFIYFLFIYT